MIAPAMLFSGAVLALAWILGGGLAGWIYVLLFALAAAAGLPIGFAIFGRRHAAGWVAGGLIGYGLTQLALWAVIVTGLASTTTFLLAWGFLTGSTLAVRVIVGSEPLLDMPAWAPADSRTLLWVLLLVPALMAPPYINIGRADASGNRYYRAYFTADFLWHSALASELGKFSLPPRNPYLTPRPMNYYWTYFLLPATVAQLAPSPDLRDVQKPLKVNALLVGILMVGVLFLLVRCGVAGPGAAGAAVAIAILAASAEGTYAILDLLRRGRPLDGLLDINVDAVTAWAPFEGLRIDNIPRSLWYTPQHTTSIALGLTGLLIATIGGAASRPGAIAGAGLALGLATTMNPLLGGACSLIYAASVLVDGFSRPGGIRSISPHVLAAIPVTLAVAWGSASRLMDGAASALSFGFVGLSRHSPFVTLMLSLGPVLIPALVAVPFARRRAGVEQRAAVVAIAGIVLGLFLLYFVRITEASWVGFRAGQILLASIPILLAQTLARVGRRPAVVLALAILIVGLPTTLVDTWNAYDIGNRRPGPGFRWTLWTTPAQQEAFAWIQAHTPPDAIVQMEPIVRGREHWTLIPSFAGRRMAAGLPISLLPLPDYMEKSDQVRRAFASADAAEASTIARRLRIDYLYVDDTDKGAYPDGVWKFDRAPQLFERVFTNAEVSVYRVL